MLKWSTTHELLLCHDAEPTLVATNIDMVGQLRAKVIAMQEGLAVPQFHRHLGLVDLVLRSVRATVMTMSH